jgi:hypothetical protein
LNHYLHVSSFQFVIIVAAGFTVQSAQADFPELLRRVPAEANAIMLIDADRLFASPMAVREGWKKKQLAEFAERPLAIPPQATKIIRAAHVDLQSDEAQWELVLIEQPTVRSVDEVAKREKGYVDKIANTKVVWSPRGAYAVGLGKGTLGLLFPANRQFLARWLKTPPGKISDYLLAAGRSMAAAEPQLLLALDLEDAIDPEQLRAALKTSKTVAAAKGDTEALAAVLEDVRGVKFEIVFKDKPWGRLMLEFNHDPAALVGICKPVVTEILDRHGMELDDIQNWSVKHNETSIALHGELSASGLLRFGSLFELPSIELDPSEEPVVADKPQLYATQNHFKAVGKLLDDLFAQKKDAKTLGQLAMWTDQYAKRIDRLPLVNVDPDMTKYSAGVADDLRQISSSIKGSGIRSGVQSANTNAAYGGGTYNYYGARAADAEQMANRARERGTSALTASQISDQIRADTSRVRRQMTERYKVEF